ncbi:MAG TPA: vitamin K epoxide reductase family protein [Beutenbergiaceae bacterium]|nr:vitamin K epoxide reductase family protein [Beutenbergiaceae bacterium]
MSTSATQDRHDGVLGEGPDNAAGGGELGDEHVSAIGTEHERTGGAGRGYALLLLISGLLGTLASIALTVDYINLLRNPDYVPACDINPLIGCGTFLGSPQASAFGFPNVIIGLVAFPVVATIAVVLFTQARLPRWFWRGLLLGTVFGIGFVTWLQYQSFTQIGALCPYCMLVWLVMIPLFVHTVARCAQNGALPAGQGLRTFLVRYRWALTALWYLAVVAGAMFGLGDRLLLMF